MAAERLISALEGHVETLKAELAAERERTGQSRAEIERERARAEKAVSDYMRLADEYQRRADDEVAAERSRPWWKRIAG
jgi:multidrug resistance efflux pump